MQLTLPLRGRVTVTNDKILAFKREIRVLEATSSVYESDTFLIPGDVSGTQPVILTITVYGCVVINSGRGGAHLCPRIDSCRPALGPVVQHWVPLSQPWVVRSSMSYAVRSRMGWDTE